MPQPQPLLLLLLLVALTAAAERASAGDALPDVDLCGSPGGLLALARARHPDLLASSRDAEAAAAAAGALIQGQPLLALVVAKYRMFNWTPGWNAWFHQAQLAASATLDWIPNPFVLYSINWLDLKDAGPTVFSFGDSGGRVFVAQGIDAWANNVFQLGFRCGPDPAAGGPWRCPASVPPGEWLLLPPGRKAGSLPADVRARYEGRTLEMPTAAVLLVVRTWADPDRAGDEAAAREVQKSYQARALGTHKPTGYAVQAHSGALLRLASYSRNATRGAPGLLAAIAGLSRAFPLRDKAEARAFKELLRAAGLRPGRGFSQRYSSPRDEGIVGAGALLGMDCVDAKIAAGSIGVDLPGGWSFTNASSLAQENQDYLLRAARAKALLLQLPPNAQPYFTTSKDGDGAPLSGDGSAYEIHFPPPGAPPAVYQWSLTLYDPATGRPALPNALNRTSVASTTPGLELGQDGSLTVTVSAEAPAAVAAASNWLPAPPGPFLLALRLLGPSTEDVANGGYHPPPVVRVPGPTASGDSGVGSGT